ncbi:dTDP-4-dehydrorhamnose reductase [Salegentibacter sp. F188]|uniref:dTDP-4-dehydrorhamnose reductase n=1 Tax=Autumnicola patrickiae TaxID=3075591 RepID=A0ABU3E0Y1_9FLAO|nr:dTDP-4-dehydrorhamnose reductase [Salegentibacter sp. F188]MDT0689626.1 dTDP-4-dehydrorhamnose reductase [Salegentibacter sp. F188]
MKSILVTGASGQLGRCFEKLSSQYSQFDFVFMSSSELDITNKCDLTHLFAAKDFDYCINCAAYTNVEKAESEKEKAFKVNAEAPKILADICHFSNTTLFHFSTDYVFNGNSKMPYAEDDKTDPINVYGASKLKGEENIRKSADKYFIFRTSWLYSEFNHNFFNTILRKAEEKATLNITTAQKGTPTNANDLAQLVMQIIVSENANYGVYHFSNDGEATWYDFAEAILEISGNTEVLELNKDNSYKTVAKRPEYSVLSKKEVQQNFNIPLIHWRESLEQLYNSAISKKSS